MEKGEDGGAQMRFRVSVELPGKAMHAWLRFCELMFKSPGLPDLFSRLLHSSLVVTLLRRCRLAFLAAALTRFGSFYYHHLNIVFLVKYLLPSRATYTNPNPK